MAKETNNPQQVPLNCRACEELVADALDESLSAAEQSAFERHLQFCTACADRYAEAQRGAAWLEMLKHPRPLPRPELLVSILARTSGAHPARMPLESTLPLTPEVSGVGLLPTAPGRVLAFRRQPTVMHRLGQLMLEPRLAMTAAMAFFSITLTMSLTGMHAGDLNPSALRRSVHSAQAGAIRYYDNLRVVHVLESHVDGVRESLREDRMEETPAPETPRPGTGKTQPAPDGGSSYSTPQSGHAPNDLSLTLTSTAILPGPWNLNGELL